MKQLCKVLDFEGIVNIEVLHYNHKKRFNMFAENAPKHSIQTYTSFVDKTIMLPFFTQVQFSFLFS